MDTHTLIQAFYASKALVWHSPKTASSYRSVLSQLEAQLPLYPTGPEPLEYFLASLHISPYSRFTYWRILQTFFRWASKRYGLENPLAEVQTPKASRPRPRILSLSEVYRLLEHPSHIAQVRLLLHLLADTGIRIGEAASLTLDDLREDSIIVRGKTGEREVPCSQDIVATLRERAPSEGSIFSAHIETLKRTIRDAFRRAGFRGHRLGPHTLRHTFATLWEGSEADLQQILGHKSPEMTFWYRQWRIDRAKRDHQLYSPRMRALKEEGVPRQARLL